MLHDKENSFFYYFNIIKSYINNSEILIFNNDFDTKNIKIFSCSECNMKIILNENKESLSYYCNYCNLNFLELNGNSYCVYDKLNNSDLIIYTKMSLLDDKYNKTLSNLMNYRNSNCYFTVITSINNEKLNNEEINDNNLIKKNLEFIEDSYMFKEVSSNEILINVSLFKNDDFKCDFESFWNSFKTKFLEFSKTS